MLFVVHLETVTVSYSLLVQHIDFLVYTKYVLRKII